MKRMRIWGVSIILSITVVQISNAQKKNVFGEGYARISYINVHNCKVEFQSFDSTITEEKLNQLMPFLYRIGTKDNGIENQFPFYRVYDFTKSSDTKEKLLAYSKKSIKEFEKSVAKLKSTKIPDEFELLKVQLLEHYTRRLQFEKIIRAWFVSGNDTELRTQITSFYKDAYVSATLDKTLTLNDIDKLRYTYIELFDIMYARMFHLDKVQKVQNKVFFDNKIEVVIDAECSKS